MKTFIWINGKDVVVFDTPNKDDAISFVLNYSDHRKEIIIREVDSIDFQSELKTKNKED